MAGLRAGFRSTGWGLLVVTILITSTLAGCTRSRDGVNQDALPSGPDPSSIEAASASGQQLLQEMQKMNETMGVTNSLMSKLNDSMATMGKQMTQMNRQMSKMNGSMNEMNRYLSQITRSMKNFGPNLNQRSGQIISQLTRLQSALSSHLSRIQNAIEHLRSRL